MQEVFLRPRTFAGIAVLGRRKNNFLMSFFTLFPPRAACAAATVLLGLLLVAGSNTRADAQAGPFYYNISPSTADFSNGNSITQEGAFSADTLDCNGGYIGELFFGGGDTEAGPFQAALSINLSLQDYNTGATAFAKMTQTYTETYDPISQLFDITAPQGPAALLTFSNGDTRFVSLNSISAQVYPFDDSDTVPQLVTISPAPVPEASSVVSFGLLLAFGLGGVIVARRKKVGSAL